MNATTSVFAGYASQSGSDAEEQGKLSFEGWRLVFRSPRVALEFPLTRLQISSGENGRVSFTDPTQPAWSLFAVDQEILKHRALLEQPHTRNQIRQLQAPRELSRRLLIVIAVVAGFALLVVMVSALTGVMTRSLVAGIPVQWESQLGDELAADMKAEVSVIEAPKLNARLSNAVAPLLQALPRTGLQYKFYIVEEPRANAFALPGGHVFVTTGMLDARQTPEEIAGAVAHELAHVTLRHGFRKIISTAGPYLVFRIFVGNSSGLVGFLGANSEVLVSQSYSQEYELEADAAGWDYLIKARIDPRGMISLLKKFQVEQERMKRFRAPIQAFSSHPSTTKRIRVLESKWSKLKDKSGFIKFKDTSTARE